MQNQNAPKNIQLCLEQVINQLESTVTGKRNKDSEIKYFPTAFDELNKLIFGIYRGQLTVVAGKSVVDKRAFARTLCETFLFNSEQNLPILMFSLEVDSNTIVTNMLSSLSMIDINHLNHGLLSVEDFHQISSTISQLSTHPYLYIDDNANLTLDGICASARKIHKEQGSLGVMVIDSLQLINEESTAQNSDIAAAKITTVLKALATELNTAIILTTDLNAEIEHREDIKPTHFDLPGNGAVFKNADLILYLHPEQNNKDGLTEVIVGKQRCGIKGSIQLYFDDRYLTSSPR